MTTNKKWALAGIVVILFGCGLLCLWWWNLLHKPAVLPPELTEKQEQVCNAVKAKIGKYPRINTMEGVYFDLGNGKKRWCVRR